MQKRAVCQVKLAACVDANLLEKVLLSALSQQSLAGLAPGLHPSE